jgi:hypothetical protein
MKPKIHWDVALVWGSIAALVVFFWGMVAIGLAGLYGR